MFTQREFASFLLCVIGATTLAAQNPPAVRAGDSVRVTAPALWESVHHGTLVSVRDDSLTFQDADAGGASTTVATMTVTQFEFSHDAVHPRHYTLRGAVLGGFSGAALGALLAAATYSNSPPPSCKQFFCMTTVPPSRSTTVGAAAYLGFWLGAGLGAAIGRGKLKPVRYEQATLSSLGTIASTLTVAPRWDAGTGGAGVTIGFTF